MGEVYEFGGKKVNHTELSEAEKRHTPDPNDFRTQRKNFVVRRLEAMNEKMDEDPSFTEEEKESMRKDAVRDANEQFDAMEIAQRLDISGDDFRMLREVENPQSTLLFSPEEKERLYALAQKVRELRVIMRQEAAEAAIEENRLSDERPRRAA